MKKIKKFKLKISPHLVERKLKEQTHREILPEEKKIIREKIQEVENFLFPATVYETFKPEQIFPWLIKPEQLTQVTNSGPFTDECVALTIFVVILGQKEEFVKEGNLSGIYQAIRDTAEEQAIRFIYRLVNEEVRKENCLPGAIFDLSEEEKIKKIFKLFDLSCLGLSKENIFSEEYGLRTGIIPWFSKRKSKKKEK